MTIIEAPESARRVLFVDDDNLILRAFKRDLSGTDFVISLANSAAEGLVEIERHPYAVVISDFNMPGMDGIEFFEEVKRRNPNIVRILTSGMADFKTAIEVINRVGLFHFVVKPWARVDLMATITRAIEHYSLTVENRRLTEQLAQNVGELRQLNHTLEDRVRDRTSSLLHGLSNALDFRDTETQTHSRRVALYTRRLARQLGIEGDELLAIERGALLHDIGKIGVSDTILLKPGKLTDDEWVEMRKHSEHGYRILKDSNFLGDARQLVYEHHERWDGKGYPRGLRGKEISIGARMFAVVDTYDAMTTDRPYRKALSHLTAITEIKEMRGTQFDPEVVDAWLVIPQSELNELCTQIDLIFEEEK